MNDDKPRKTLTVAPKGARRASGPISPRTGARARNASTLRPTAPASAADGPAQRPPRPARPGDALQARGGRGERPERSGRPEGPGRAGSAEGPGRAGSAGRTGGGQGDRTERRPPRDSGPRVARSDDPRPPRRDAASAPAPRTERQDRPDRPWQPRPAPGPRSRPDRDRDDAHPRATRSRDNAYPRPAQDRGDGRSPGAGSRGDGSHRGPAGGTSARPPRPESRAPGRPAGASLRDRVTELPPAPARAVVVADDATQFSVFAPCPQGLEALLADELNALGYADVLAGRAGCHFTADWPGVLGANLHSRLATRILVRVAHAPVSTEDDILALAAAVPWERWFGPAQSLRVDTSAVRSPMRSLQYCNLRAKDGICDRLRAREGARPSIDTVRPDARVHLFLDATSATLYLDTSGESLFKRGWRLDKGEAPLRENLAAGLLALSGWQPDQALVDPFCGSGTILIEAAWKALGVPAGIWRPFGFERLRTHDFRQWMDLKEEARARIASKLEVPLVGCDLDPRAIEAARQNLRRARLAPDAIHFEVNDACALLPPAPTGCIVTNPPYGERLASQGDTLWPAWASWLKQHYGGWRAHVVTAELDLPGRLRLQAARRTPVRNGDLDCRLFSFDIVSRSPAA